MRNTLTNCGGLLALCVSVFCLSFCILHLLISRSMETTGKFHGEVFSVSKLHIGAGVCLLAGLAFLGLAIQAVRTWLRNNPRQQMPVREQNCPPY